jgi:hypothetical protein
LKTNILDIFAFGQTLRHVYRSKWPYASSFDILIYSSGIFANIGRANWSKGITDTLLQARINFKKKKEEKKRTCIRLIIIKLT